MKRAICAAITAAACVILGHAGTVQSASRIAFIGKGSIPGTARDGSGLRGLLEDGVTTGDQVGGLGSAIAYSGNGDLFNDNDFIATQTNNFYVFAIEPWVLPGYKVQQISFQRKCDRDADRD